MLYQRKSELVSRLLRPHVSYPSTETVSSSIACVNTKHSSVAEEPARATAKRPGANRPAAG